MVLEENTASHVQESGIILCLWGGRTHCLSHTAPWSLCSGKEEALMQILKVLPSRRKSSTAWKNFHAFHTLILLILVLLFRKKKAKIKACAPVSHYFIHFPIQKGFLVTFSRSKSLNLSFSPYWNCENMSVLLLFCFHFGLLQPSLLGANAMVTEKQYQQFLMLYINIVEEILYLSLKPLCFLKIPAVNSGCFRSTT